MHILVGGSYLRLCRRSLHGRHEIISKRFHVIRGYCVAVDYKIFNNQRHGKVVLIRTLVEIVICFVS